MLCSGGLIFHLIEYLNMPTLLTLMQAVLADIEAQHESLQSFHSSFAVYYFSQSCSSLELHQCLDKCYT
jgi:hypothetical protein